MLVHDTRAAGSLKVILSSLRGGGLKPASVRPFGVTIYAFVGLCTLVALIMIKRRYLANPRSNLVAGLMTELRVQVQLQIED